MKKVRVFMTVLLAVIMATTTLIGCRNSDPSGEKIDETKTQLYISNFDGGFGSEWIKPIKTRFEDFYKNESFEDGKVGVQIIVDASKVSGVNLLGTVKSSRDHVIINEAVYYYDYLSQGVMEDISDVVTSSLSVYGEDKTIESKMSDEQKSFLNSNGKYYAVPHYAGLSGIVYDVELFNSKKLYLAEDNVTFNKTNTSKGLSKGVDGISGTYDDGLPATYDQFYALCKTMIERSITPIIWSGQYQFYANSTLTALAQTANGFENAKLNFSFNGTTDRYVNSVDANGNVSLSNKVITEDNAYDVFRQSGYYYALEFMHEIVNKEYCDLDSFTKGISHVDTQDAFLLSNRDYSKQAIGMMIEGNWWENEASTTFEAMDNSYENSSKMDRKFGFMPLPKPTDAQVGEANVLQECSSSFMFVKTGLDKAHLDLAKKFIAFANTDTSLVEYTVSTNTAKALKYDLSSTDLEKMSYFGRSIIEMKNDPSTKVIYPVSQSDLYNKNMKAFALDLIWEYGSYSYPSTAFHDNPTLTAKTYFDAMVASWKNKISYMG